MKAADLNRWVTMAQEEAIVVRDSLRDKGPKYFMRPIALGLLMVLGTRHFLYDLPQNQLSNLDLELEAAKATAKYATTYQDLRDKLTRLQTRLPKNKDPEGWLLSAIRESLREEGIVPTSFEPPQISVSESYRFISIQVRCDASYQQIASWISRLERGDSLLYIKTLAIQKKPKPIGSNEAIVTITTVVPDKPVEGQGT